MSVTTSTVSEAHTNGPAAAVPSLGAIEDADKYGVQVTAVKTAMELDIFDRIAEGNHSLEAIAAAAECSHSGMRVLLDALCVLKLLEKSNGQYHLSPTAQTYLVSSSATYCTPIYLAWLQNRDHFIDFVRTGQAQMNLMHPDAEPLWVSYVAPTRLQWPNLTALATQGWTRAGILPLAKQGMRILDVGCGSGFKSFTLLQHDPTAHVTAVDSPRVLEIAADIAGQMQVTSQVSFQVGNIADTLAPESFDLILYGSLMHYYPVDECIGILSKAWKALKKDGRVIVNSMIMDEERTESAGLLSMIDISNCAPFAQNYTFSEYKSMLQAAGFANVVQASPAMVIGYKGE